MPSNPERPRRIVATDGPLLVEGPVEVVGKDGTVSVSRRFVVAVCTCRGSRTYPWCDTSHRRRRGRAARGGGRASSCPGGQAPATPDAAEEES
ncbi:CDGSH iron-sulfur domain-containing protein [Streptomyces sp. RS10V-4]|uniref:CDGSH iron-sulfur domain-containing protein n=1 Tax=Streptomyces rhizoryzae TaxID=2932493 RepID=UPI0020053F4C|nr:CDGSH iron-sulfur domain-containing protein [Streptomyces rhizoryzae]MCK7624399.1 CDGSH iron-sulfur domain-containing protein [Streptomyces rhizoryzae]